jgi:hypothetical protein
MTNATLVAKTGLPSMYNHSVQPKLEINQPGDRYEQEADAMADSIMRLSSIGAPVKPVTGLVGRSIQRNCAACQEEKNELMCKTEGLGYGVQASPLLFSSIKASKGGGTPLPHGTRNFMENAFSTDFSRVRVHTDSEASEMSRGINAQAFTIENDIYFNHRQYQPETYQGKKLLAHELTHVTQFPANSKLSRRIVDGSETSWKEYDEGRKAHEKTLRIIPDIILKRKNIHLTGDDKYGHWWLEIADRDESFGWWPKQSVGFKDTIFGTDGELNATYFGGRSKSRGDATSHDPHHKDSAEEEIPVNSDRRDINAIKDDIEKFSYSYSGEWRWTLGWGQNCHTFQEKLLDKVGLEEG